MWIFFCVHMISSTYSYAWDIYMDWGLLRCWDKGKYALREKLNYPVWFYYYSMVTDFFLRYVWLMSLFSWYKGSSGWNHDW